jgi:hypothetical protein
LRWRFWFRFSHVFIEENAAAIPGLVCLGKVFLREWVPNRFCCWVAICIFINLFVYFGVLNSGFDMFLLRIMLRLMPGWLPEIVILGEFEFVSILHFD